MTEKQSDNLAWMEKDLNRAKAKEKVKEEEIGAFEGSA